MGSFSGPIQHIALLFAMEGEARPLLETLSLAEQTNKPGSQYGIRYFEGTLKKLKVTVALNGQDPHHNVDNIGTESAALAAHCLIEAYQPHLVVSAGTAGGFVHHGTKIADIFLSQEHVVRHDHRIAIPGFDTYGQGRFPVLTLNHLPNLLQAKTGIITTGNSLDATEMDLDVISELNAHVKEMEAAAIARVAQRNQTAFLAIKAITDFADSPENHDEFIQNYSAACTKLKDTLVSFLTFLSDGRSFEEL